MVSAPREEDPRLNEIAGDYLRSTVAEGRVFVRTIDFNDEQALSASALEGDGIPAARAARVGPPRCSVRAL